MALLRPILFCIFIAVSAAAAENKPEPGEAAVKALREIMPKWEMIRTDRVNVDDIPGRRVVLRQTVKDYTSIHQQGAQQMDADDGREHPFVLKHNHVEIILVAAGAKADAAKVPWTKDLEQQYYVQVVDMGAGMGFRWLGRMSLWEQESIREQLKLEGGEDRIALAIAGMKIDDQGSCTRNSCAWITSKFGDAAVPYLKEAALKADGGLATQYATNIRQIPGEKATAALRELYKSDNKHVRSGAAHGLVHSRPVRTEAKAEYIEMVREGEYAQYAVGICAQEGWKEALGDIEKVFHAPPDWWTFRAAWRAIRQLKGREIPKDLEAAGRTLTFTEHGKTKPTPEQIDQAKAVFTQHKDRDAAVFLATELAFFTTKGGARQTNEIGMEILRQLPAEEVRPIVECLTQRMRNEDWRKNAIGRLGPLK